MSDPAKKFTAPVVTPPGKAPEAGNSSTPPPAPELRAVLTGFMSEEERAAVRDAYYNGSRGDPKSYPVQIALVQRALFLALDAAPGQIGKRLDATLSKLNALMSAYQTALKSSTEAVNQHAKSYGEQLEAIKVEFNRELQAHRLATSKEVEAVTAGVRMELHNQRQMLEQKMTELNRLVRDSEATYRTVASHASTLKLAKEHVYWIAGFAIFLFGVVAFPLIGAGLDAIRSWLHF
jgi:hypothetical protein